MAVLVGTELGAFPGSRVRGAGRRRLAGGNCRGNGAFSPAYGSDLRREQLGGCGPSGSLRCGHYRGFHAPWIYSAGSVAARGTRDDFITLVYFAVADWLYMA